MKTIDQPMTTADAVITEVRRHKEAILAEHNYDVDALLQHLRERQTGNRLLVSRPVGDPGGNTSAPGR